jgi:hypothetical protein
LKVKQEEKDRIPYSTYGLPCEHPLPIASHGGSGDLKMGKTHRLLTLKRNGLQLLRKRRPLDLVRELPWSGNCNCAQTPVQYDQRSNMKRKEVSELPYMIKSSPY